MGARSSASPRPSARAIDPDAPFWDRYWDESRRPLTILVFLLPLVLAYEAGLLFLLPADPAVMTNLAHDTLLRFFSVFGVTAGLSVPAIVLLVVLLLWHLLAREAWRVDGRTLLAMLVETLLLTIPLLVVAQVIARVVPDGSVALSAVAGGPAGADPGAALDARIGQMSLWGKLTISLGAGIYEELVFRMLLIAVVHTLLVDVLRMPSGWGASVAIVLSAVVFTLFHPIHDERGGVMAQRAIFYFTAGLYFGALYVARGFGIVVGVHALYDVAVSVFLLPQEGS